jgi:solute:Na+ symporter, SSS family
MKIVNLLDYVVIFVYMMITLGVGFYFMRFNKGAADYFKGGNKIPWMVSGLSAFMTGFSAWTFTAASGIAYNDGVIIILLYMGNALTFLFGYWLFAARWRRSRISSPMEYLSERFDHSTRQTFSWSTVFFDLFMVAVWLFALGKFMAVALQIPIHWIIIISSLIILIYCMVGGLWAVVITDFIQGIILIPFTIILAFAALYKLGGISEFINLLPPEMLEVGHSEYSSWIFLMSWTVMVIFGYNTRAHAQRYFSVDTEKSAKKISLLNFVLFLLGSFIWFIPPMATRILYPDIAAVWPGSDNPQEGAYAIISLTILPHGLIGVMLAAIFSACMSNVSSFYNMFSAIITLDIIPKLTKKELDDKKQLYVGRITTLAIGIIVPLIALIMVFSGKSAFSLLNTFNSIISIAYGPPALIGFLSKKAPHWSGLLYFVIALVLGIVGWFVLGWGIPENVLYVIPLSVVIMFGVPLVTKNLIKEKDVYKKNRALFFEKLNTPIDFEKEIGSIGDIGFVVFNFLAKVTAIMAVISLLFLFANPGDESITIILYSGLTLALAVVFFILGKKNKSSYNKIRNEHAVQEST